MSGSNALAAAKRRRGGSETKGPAPPGSRNIQNNPQQSVPPGVTNPLQLVAFNHQRLNRLSDELPKSIDALGESFNALSSNCDFLHDQFTQLEKRVGLLMLNQQSQASNVVQPVPQVDVSRFEQLSRDLEEIHRVITRMQSFSMDLSNSVSKTKEQFDTHNNDLTSSINQLNSRIDAIEQNVNNLFSTQHYLSDVNNRLDKLDSMVENLVNSSNSQLNNESLVENEDNQ